MALSNKVVNDTGCGHQIAGGVLMAQRFERSIEENTHLEI
jgi:hypothetical protein